MASDQFDLELKAWGHATVNRFSYRTWERTDHVLAKQREFGVASKRDDREPVGRDGRERREYMARRSGVKGMKVLPIWAVDPVRAANDADPPKDLPEAVVDMGIPDHLLWIDRAISRLFRENMVRALCLKEELCGIGTHEAKAKAVAAAYGGTLTVRQFRKELQLAKEWMRGRKAA